jgi:transmembrane sensor
VGTVVRVERLPDRVVVSVSRGTVLVRGENVPGWVQKVTAGQRVEVRAHSETQRRSEQAPPQAVPAGSAPTVESMTSPPVPGSEAGAVAAEQPARVRRTRSARRSALDRLQGSPRERYEALGAQGFARETAAATSVESLLQLADIARLSGHPRDAVQPLTRALEAFRRSPQAALAAFTLGRVLLDQLYLPEPAAATFERAIALRLPRALLPDCYRRLAEAYDRLRAALAGAESQ